MGTSTIMSSMGGFETLRRFPRYKLDLPVRVIVTKESNVAIIQGRGNELNEGGMAVFAGVEMKLDETMAVEFTPPYSGQPLRARAIVRNRSGYKYGLEFLTESEEDQQKSAQIRSVLQGFGTVIG